MGEEDADLITWVRAAMVHAPEPEITFCAPTAANAGDNAGGTGAPRSRVNKGLVDHGTRS